MHIKFSEAELEWIDKEFMNWHPKKGCPTKLKKSIEKKLALLEKERSFYAENINRRND